MGQVKGVMQEMNFRVGGRKWVNGGKKPMDRKQKVTGGKQEMNFKGEAGKGEGGK
jgi:hypothetical protein